MILLCHLGKEGTDNIYNRNYYKLGHYSAVTGSIRVRQFDNIILYIIPNSITTDYKYLQRATKFTNIFKYDYTMCRLV